MSSIEEIISRYNAIGKGYNLLHRLSFWHALICDPQPDSFGSRADLIGKFTAR